MVVWVRGIGIRVAELLRIQYDALEIVVFVGQALWLIRLQFLAFGSLRAFRILVRDGGVVVQRRL